MDIQELRSSVKGQVLTEETALAAVSGEPLRESAHRALIRVHMAQGNWFDALRQYDLYRDLVRGQLGLDPSPEMEHLVAPLQRR